MSRFVITGVTGGAPNRLEINDFVKNDKFFSLYIQALQLMQKDSQSNVQSFFQVSGIHGLPNQSWNDATSDTPADPDQQWAGYCTHGSVLFPTWHRPYVMCYEQIIQKLAEGVAATYTVDQAEWKQAAADLRAPYWDWAANAVPPAEVISLKKVSITGPNGGKLSVDNPLYQYAFHPIDPSFPDQFSSWQTTLRQPDTTDSNAIDNVARLTGVLSNAQSNITTSTYTMLTRVRNWPSFSNHTIGDGGNTSNSLEAIHDSIHVNVGGNGHMADPSVAAFDPIFYLHHANVDRLLSIWSALNPGVSVSQGDAENGTFTLPAGVPVDGNTDLTPFWNDQTTFWTSAATNDTSRLGYTYPDFNGLDMNNTAAVQQAIGNIVNNLYGSSLFGSFASRPSSLSPTSALAASPPPQSAGKQQPLAVPVHPAAAPNVPAPPAVSRIVAAPHAPSQDSPAHLTFSVEGQSSVATSPDHGLYDWTARVEFKKYEIGSSFSVLIFLNTVPEDPNEWLVSANLAGSIHAFVNSAAVKCANCRNQAGLVQEGFVHLNQSIAKHSGLGSLEPQAVEPYLIQNLHWRVQKSNGEPAELASLEISVIATALSYPPGAQFPVPGTTRRHERITQGRPGGSRQI